MQTSKDLGTGEWDMQKEPDGGIRETLPDHIRDKHEMIVIDPD